MQKKTYITLGALATRLSLSQAYLRRLADSNQIPYLDVNGRKRFDEVAVSAVLDKIEQPRGRLLTAKGRV